MRPRVSPRFRKPISSCLFLLFWTSSQNPNTARDEISNEEGFHYCWKGGKEYRHDERLSRVVSVLIVRMRQSKISVRDLRWEFLLWRESLGFAVVLDCCLWYTSRPRVAWGSFVHKRLQYGFITQQRMASTRAIYHQSGMGVHAQNWVKNGTPLTFTSYNAKLYHVWLYHVSPLRRRGFRVCWEGYEKIARKIGNGNFSQRNQSSGRECAFRYIPILPSICFTVWNYFQCRLQYNLLTSRALLFL